MCGLARYNDILKSGSFVREPIEWDYLLPMLNSLLDQVVWRRRVGSDNLYLGLFLFKSILCCDQCGGDKVNSGIIERDCLLDTMERSTNVMCWVRFLYL